MKRLNNLIYQCYFLTFLVAGILAGCGGGGGGNSASPGKISSTPTPSIPAAANEAIIKIGAPNFNIPYTSVTVCVPGSTINCKTIDNILVDTGSTGLRIFQSALTASFENALPVRRNANQRKLAECAQFADGVTWGPLFTADVGVAEEKASAVTIQVIEDKTYPIAKDCSGNQTFEETSTAFGANGVLGLDYFKQDCGLVCEYNPANGMYYECDTKSCVPATVALANQLQNVAALFPVNNNGVMISLPGIPAAGAVTVTGSLFFGIGTADNNQLGNAKIISVDSLGNFVTRYNANSNSKSFADSGSNGIFFSDNSIPLCGSNFSGFYCPTKTLNLTATISSAAVSTTTGASVAVAFNVVNLTTLSGANYAFNNVAGSAPASITGSFDWGLPFYYGKKVFTAFEGSSTPVGNGPYFAF